MASAVCFVADMPDEIRIRSRAKASVMTRCFHILHPNKMARTDFLQSFCEDSGIDPSRCLQKQTCVRAVAHIQPEFEYDDLRFLTTSQQLLRDFWAKMSWSFQCWILVFFRILDLFELAQLIPLPAMHKECNCFAPLPQGLFPRWSTQLQKIT